MNKPVIFASWSEKKHILQLLEELKEITLNIGMISRSNQDVQNKAADRMLEIKKELQDFRRKYPYD